MSKRIQARYTREFRAEAVKLAQQDGMSIRRAATQLQMSASTLENWVRAVRQGQALPSSVVDPRDAEISRLKRELHEARLERDLLKKAAAYFARESVQGTR